MYVVFEGVRDKEGILRILLSLTDGDVQCASDVIGVQVPDDVSARRILEDPGLVSMEDTPEGFWTMELRDDDYFLDRMEAAVHRAGRRGRRK